MVCVLKSPTATRMLYSWPSRVSTQYSIVKGGSDQKIDLLSGCEHKQHNLKRHPFPSHSENPPAAQGQSWPATASGTEAFCWPIGRKRRKRKEKKKGKEREEEGMGEREGGMKKEQKTVRYGWTAPSTPTPSICSHLLQSKSQCPPRGRRPQWATPSPPQPPPSSHTGPLDRRASREAHQEPGSVLNAAPALFNWCHTLPRAFSPFVTDGEMDS